MNVSTIAKKYLFTRPKHATFSPSSLYSFPPEKTELEHLPLLHLPIIERHTKRWTGEWTNAYLHLFPGAKYLIIYAHPTSVDIGMVAQKLFYVGLDTQCHVLAFEYTGYGCSQSETSEETMYADAFSAYWFARSVLKVPRSRIILMGRSIGSAVLSNLAANLPSVEEEKIQDEINKSNRRSSSNDKTAQADRDSYSFRIQKSNSEVTDTRSCGSEKSCNHDGTPGDDDPVDNDASYSFLPLVVLQCPFTDIASCIESLSPIPYTTSCVHFFGLNWFRTIDIIDRILAPVLLHHGSEDKLVPFSHTLQLKQKRDQSDRALVTYLHEELGSGHNNLSTNYLISALLARLNLSIPSLIINFPNAFVAQMPLYEMFFNMNPSSSGQGKESVSHISAEKPLSGLVPSLPLNETNNNDKSYSPYPDSSAVKAKKYDSRNPHSSHVELWRVVEHCKSSMLPIRMYVHDRSKLAALLTLSVSLFSIRCAMLWKAYRQSRLSNGIHLRAAQTTTGASSESSFSRSHSTSSFLDYFFGSSSKSLPALSHAELSNRSPNNSCSLIVDSMQYKSMESKTEFILGCMARWGSPLGIHIGFSSNNTGNLQHIVFGSLVDSYTSNPQVDMNPCLDLLAQKNASPMNRTNEMRSNLDVSLNPNGRRPMNRSAHFGEGKPCESDFSSALISVAELQCTPGLMSAIRGAFSASSSHGHSTNSCGGASTVLEHSSLSSHVSGFAKAHQSIATDTDSALSPPNRSLNLSSHNIFSACFISEEHVSEIQSECERLVAFLPAAQWQYWEQLLQYAVPAEDGDTAVSQKVGEPILMKSKKASSALLSYLSPQCQDFVRKIGRTFSKEEDTRTPDTEDGFAVQQMEHQLKRHDDPINLSFTRINPHSILENESMQDLEDFMVPWKDVVESLSAKSFLYPLCSPAETRNSEPKKYLRSDKRNIIQNDRDSGAKEGNRYTISFDGPLANEISWDYYLCKARALSCHKILNEDMPWEDIQSFFHEHTTITNIYKMWLKQIGTRAQL